MPKIVVEFIFNQQAINISDFRKVLRTALLKVGLPVLWNEWQANDPAIPLRLKSSAPFSLFINKELIFVADSNFPSEAFLIQLFKSRLRLPTNKNWYHQYWSKSNLSLWSAIGIFLLPKCPICWAAYMSFFSGLGFSTITYQSWWLPLMILILGLSIGATLYQAYQQKRKTYMLLTIIGTILLLVGKLILNINSLVYLGLATFFVAYLRHQFILKNSIFSSFLVKRILRFSFSKNN